jgi:hypothetical protein
VYEYRVKKNSGFGVELSGEPLKTKDFKIFS